MDSHLKRGIKEIIQEYPAVGVILERYDIGCVPCAVGTCKLEDVVKIHDLAPEDEAALMAQIAYSPPVRKLVDEHVWIKRLLAIVPTLVENTWIEGAVDAELMRRVIDFVRGYADRFHHMKEEDILFDYTDREAEVIRVIYEDHRQARAFVAAAAEAIEVDDLAALCQSLTNHRELLTEHIDKEDQVLFPYIDRGLTADQVAEMARRFRQAEDETDADVPGRYERFIVELESRYGPQ